MTPLLTKRGYRVVRVDLLGHGGSAKPDKGYAMTEQADRVAAALKILKVRRALVSGHSTGGEVAIALAARHPELARRLIVMDTEPHEEYVNIEATGKLSTTPLTGELIWGTAPDDLIREGIKQAFADDQVPVPQQFVDDVKSMTYRSFDDTADESASYVDEGTEERDIKSVRVPVLIMFGSADRLIDAKPSITRFREWLPDAETVEIAGAGHSPLWERPAETSAEFVRFDRARSDR
jgi:pimeloyl-ACP methyl ester carboxylesterase